MSTSPTARAVALEALDRIDPGGAYANLVLPELLRRSGLDERDRHFATELVYGTTRRRRACDHLVDRFLTREVEPHVRNALRLGAYQLHHLGLPPHAAVGETVEVVPRRARGFVNAVLRRVAEAPVAWPDDATRLSYPDWVVERLRADLGEADALAALETMDRAPTVTERDDGYVQDPASRWVAEAVGAAAGERVLDLCAAPGGKSLVLAATGARVVAADQREGRARLVVANAADAANRSQPVDEALEEPRPSSTGSRGVALPVVVADGRHAPFPRRTFDRVLVDAPCSGLGVLRRRPDARWRVDADAVARLAALQRELVDAALGLLRPGGLLVYSVCTLTDVEGPALDRHLEATRPELVAEPPPLGWRPVGRGGRVLPQDHDTDGMYLLRLRVP